MHGVGWVPSHLGSRRRFMLDEIPEKACSTVSLARRPPVLAPIDASQSCLIHVTWSHMRSSISYGTAVEWGNINRRSWRDLGGGGGEDDKPSHHLRLGRHAPAGHLELADAPLDFRPSRWVSRPAAVTRSCALGPVCVAPSLSLDAPRGAGFLHTALPHPAEYRWWQWSRHDPLS